MNAQFEIILGVAMFTTVILALVAFILVARSKLVSSGSVNIEINGEKTITVPAGDKLLQTLSAAVVVVAPNVSALLMTAVAPCCQQKKGTSLVVKLLKAGVYRARLL